MNERKTYREHIEQDPRIMTGKPVVAGTRIPVERVVGHLANSPNMDDLFATYPELTIEDVKACLRYAHTVIAGDSQRVRTGLKDSAGALFGVDTKQLLADIHEAREQRRRGEAFFLTCGVPHR